MIALEADGSAMYTLQALWTMAREDLDVTTVIFNNSSYAVLNMELDRVGAAAGGEKAKAMLDLTGPTSTSSPSPRAWASPPPAPPPREEFAEQLAGALATPGPTVIEAIVPSII